MAKFVYRMQNILDIKKKLESQAEIAYGIANQKYLSEQKTLQEYMLRRTEYERELKELMTGTLDVRRVGQARSNVNTMKTIIRRQMIEVHKAELELNDARQKLNEIIMERKTHEKLREKAFEQFKEEIKESESKEIDELVSFTYNSN